VIRMLAEAVRRRWCVPHIGCSFRRFGEIDVGLELAQAIADGDQVGEAADEQQPVTMVNSQMAWAAA